MIWVTQIGFSASVEGVTGLSLPPSDSSPPVIRREHFPLLTRPYIAPRTPTERRLAEIWAEAMGIDRIGVEDRFLDLGGDSLMAAVIFSQIEVKLGVQLPMAVVDHAPTIADLAPRIDALLAQRRSPSGSSESSQAPTRGASAS